MILLTFCIDLGKLGCALLGFKKGYFLFFAVFKVELPHAYTAFFEKVIFIDLTSNQCLQKCNLMENLDAQMYLKVNLPLVGSN